MGHHTGHVFLRERVVIDGNGTTTVTGPIVGGDGGFRGAHGFVRFTGATDPTGSGAGSGTYVVRLALDR